MTAVADSRTALFDALVAELTDAPWRIHATTPAQIVAPTVYVDSVELGVDTATGAAFVTATFPVVVVADGAARPQIEALDDMLAHVWTAAMRVGNPTDSRPVALAVGGPNLRAHIVRVDVPLLAVTLCPPSLVTAANGGTP